MGGSAITINNGVSTGPVTSGKLNGTNAPLNGTSLAAANARLSGLVRSSPPEKPLVVETSLAPTRISAGETQTFHNCGYQARIE